MKAASILNAYTELTAKRLMMGLLKFSSVGYQFYFVGYRREFNGRFTIPT
jgi:hypothetical protein